MFSNMFNKPPASIIAPSDTDVTFDSWHQMHIHRDMTTGAIVGYSDYDGYREGLPPHLDPQVTATVSAAALTGGAFINPSSITTGEQAAEISEFETIAEQVYGDETYPEAQMDLPCVSDWMGEPEPVIAMIDSPQADDDDVDGRLSTNAELEVDPNGLPSINDTMFDLLVRAAGEGKLTSFHFTTSTGAKGSWSK